MGRLADPKEEEMKRYYFCKGELVEKEINHVHLWVDKLILFQQIPASICEQCGEVYIRPEVAAIFDKATLHLERVKQAIQVPVVSFSELAEI